jgi:hypothetical protein
MAVFKASKLIFLGHSDQVTFVPHDSPLVVLHIRAIPARRMLGHTTDERDMQSSPETDKRRKDRRKAVLPVKVRGKDVSGKIFEELAYTLDVTPAGARLGGVHHALNAADRLTITYRQRRVEFSVVWTKRLDGVSEYQVGLQAVAPEGDAWGLNSPEIKAADSARMAPASAAV